MQIVSLSGWSFIFYRCWDSAGIFSIFYHLVLVTSISCVAVNLFLVVLKLKFSIVSHGTAQLSGDAPEQVRAGIESNALPSRAGRHAAKSCLARCAQVIFDGTRARPGPAKHSEPS
jgi:hypothetical protein